MSGAGQRDAQQERGREQARGRARDRARGALVGLALGDALGMPTQMTPRGAVVDGYGPVVMGFRPGPADHPIAAGMAAGSVTDDTEQAVLLGRLLVAGRGRVDPRELGARLLAWEDTMRARGSLDLLGPSTRAALHALAAGGDPERTGEAGTTNGAAMRIAPVGIAVPWGGGEDPAPLVDAVVDASRVTHHTSVALAGAAAVAAAVSAGVAGADRAQAVKAAVRAAQEGARRGRWVAAADVGARILWAQDLVRGRSPADACDVVATLVGTSLATQESVPAALAVLAVDADPWTVLRAAASVGGDSDTVAAMCGAVLGACHGEAAFPEDARAAVPAVRELDLHGLADALLALRVGGRAGGPAEDAGRPAPGTEPVAGTEPGAQARAAARREAEPAVPEPEHPARPGRLVHLGNGVVDVVMSVPHTPARGGDVLATHRLTVAGGGCTVATAAARQGARVVHAGRHGTGPHGDVVRSALRAAGVQLLVPPAADGDTGHVLVLVDSEGERTFVTVPGVEAALGAADLAGLRTGPEAVRDHDLVHVSGYLLAHPAARDAVLGVLADLPAGCRVVLDPGPLVGDLPAEVLEAALRRTDVLTLNEAEARAVVGREGAEAVTALLRRLRPSRAGLTPAGGVVLRRGAAGSLVGCTARPERDPVVVAAPRVDAVDLTGAGDVHTGVLEAALLRGEELVAAVRRATAAAALGVARHGPGVPTAAEVDAALDVALEGGARRPQRS